MLISSRLCFLACWTNIAWVPGGTVDLIITKTPFFPPMKILAKLSWMAVKSVAPCGLSGVGTARITTLDCFKASVGS